MFVYLAVLFSKYITIAKAFSLNLFLRQRVLSLCCSNFVYSVCASWFLSNQDDTWLGIYVQHLSDGVFYL